MTNKNIEGIEDVMIMRFMFSQDSPNMSYNDFLQKLAKDKEYRDEVFEYLNKHFKYIKPKSKTLKEVLK